VNIPDNRWNVQRFTPALLLFAFQVGMGVLFAGGYLISLFLQLVFQTPRWTEAIYLAIGFNIFCLPLTLGLAVAGLCYRQSIRSIWKRTSLAAICGGIATSLFIIAFGYLLPGSSNSTPPLNKFTVMMCVFGFGFWIVAAAFLIERPWEREITPRERVFGIQSKNDQNSDASS